MDEIIELPINLGIQFVPMYCKPTVKYIQDFHVSEIKEPRMVLPEYLKEIIINSVAQDVINFNIGDKIIAPKDSGYLYLNYGDSLFKSDTGTYYFPYNTAMPVFEVVVNQLTGYIGSKLQGNKWEQVTMYRRV